MTEKNIEYFEMKDILKYLCCSLMMGFIIGAAATHYKNSRHQLISDLLDKQKIRYDNLQESFKQLDGNFDKKTQKLINRNSNVQYYINCHTKSEANIHFPSEIVFNEAPHIMITYIPHFVPMLGSIFAISTIIIFL